jgi:AcrR family transcriptional regulator
MNTLASNNLRERKKTKTRLLIKQHALQLFLKNGYASTTVEQIAEAAETSPSTFFRYFPTKEELMFDDSFDEALEASFCSQPAGLNPVRALRNALQAAFTDISPEQAAIEQQRHQLIAATPELQARNMQEFIRNIDLLARLIAQRTGQQPDSLSVRTLAGALVGVLISATISARPDSESDRLARSDASLAQFEANLQF